MTSPYSLKILIVSTSVYTLISKYLGTSVLAETVTMTPQQKREAAISKLGEGFMVIYDIVATIAEPFLMIVFIYGFFHFAVGKNEQAWTRIKQAGYAYIGIVMLPGIFKLLRYVGDVLRDAFNF